MKTNILVSGILLGAVAFVGAATNDLTTALQRGLFEEEANQNLGAAISAYQTVASQFDKDRKLAATAIFRLGECYRKQGNTNDAATQYERILREFSDQPTLVTLSRQSLAGMGSAPPAPAAPAISDAARQEQKRLLEEEIKLAEKQLARQREIAQRGIGVRGQSDLWAAERDLLKVKGQLAALDAGLPVSIAATEAPAPATSTEAEEVKRIQALIKDSPDLINAPDQKGVTLLESAAAKGKLAVVKVLLENGAAVDGLQQPSLTPLHYAAANGHKAIVDLLLSKGAKADAQSPSGVTLLHLAARKGYETVAKALLAAGAPVNVPTKGTASADDEYLQYHIYPGQTPLHLAASLGYSGMVELLLAKGADVNAEDSGGRTALSYAVQNHYQALVQVLLAAHADANAGRLNLPLATAAYQGDLPALKLLLANGADPNTNSAVNWSVRGASAGQDRHSPLSLAVSQGQADAAKELLRCKADPNVTAPNQTPMLFNALADAPILKVLLEGGANPNVRASEVTPQPGYGLGYPGGPIVRAPGTPLLLQAVKDRNQPAVELLLAHQADVNATNSDGWTSLDEAAAYGLKPIAELLLKSGATVDARNRNGETPLHVAVQQSQRELVELLLAHQANANATFADGATPLQVVVHRGAPGGKAIAELLLKAGADVNARDPNGDTPLHLAVITRQPALAELLLANKADPNERNNAGQTPLDLAKSPAQSAQSYPLGGPGGYPGMITPARPQRLVPGTPATAQGQESKPEAMADLLRQHGASDDLPRLDCIELRRPSSKYSSIVFTKGTNDWNQFSLMELIAVHYGLLAGRPAGESRQSYETGFARGWPFPDFAHLRIRRAGADPNLTVTRVFHLNYVDPSEMSNLLVKLFPDQLGGFGALSNLFRGGGGGTAGSSTNQNQRIKKDARVIAVADRLTSSVVVSCAKHLMDQIEGVIAELDSRSDDKKTVKAFEINNANPQQSWQEKIVDLRSAFQSTNCAADIPLAWGDVVEVPERDHPLDQSWRELPAEDVETLKKCLARQVEVVIKGQSTNLTLAPDPRFLQDNLYRPNPTALVNKGAFWIKPVLRESGLLLASSDLSRVKITRRDPATGQNHECILDCSFDSPAPDFWLRNGDRIEVPEKSAGSAAAQAEAPGRSFAGYPPAAAAQAMASVNPGSVEQGSPAPLPEPAKRVQSSFVQRLTRIPAVPSPERGPADEEAYPSIGGVLYSPKPDDPELLKDGYHRDRSARTRKGESWEQRAGADLKGRGGNVIWTGTEMIEFGGEGMGTSFDDGARYCFAEDTWAALPQEGAPGSRTGHTAIWTGKEMIVWGGFNGVWGNDTLHNDGARYNPASDTWKPVATKNAPSARVDFSAVWAGREMLVWGGFTDTHSRYQGGHADAHLNTGGRYDPSSDSWKTITTQGAPSKRWLNSMVWTGKEAIIWGGGNATKALGDGGRYNPARDSWKPVSADGAPSPRLGHVAVWTGKEMIVWGGTTRETDTQAAYFENGARYNPKTDTWRPISTIGAPKGRVQTVAVWTGAEMVIWGGVNDAQAGGVLDSGRYVGTGARYNPATDTWTEITLTGAPSPRYTIGLWTGEGLLTFGGYNGTHLNDVWFYSPSRTLYAYVKQ